MFFRSQSVGGLSADAAAPVAAPRDVLGDVFSFSVSLRGLDGELGVPPPPPPTPDVFADPDRFSGATMLSLLGFGRGWNVWLRQPSSSSSPSKMDFLDTEG